MSPLRHKLINRRFVLRGAGACLGLPLLEAMLPSSLAAPSKFRPLDRSPSRHPRSIFCYVPNGVNILEWMPKTKGVDYELSPTLQVLADHRDHFSLLSGLGHPNSKGGHSGADTWLTGADLAAVPGKQYANAISADQVMAGIHGKETRFPSLQLSDGSGTGSAGHSHTLSFDRRGTPLPAENSPQRLFERLFVPDGSDSKKETLRRYAEKKSILDSTMVMFGSGMNSGEGGAHSPKNLPLLLAGGSSLGLKHGQHLAHDTEDHPPLSNVLLTMIQKMGVESDSFQDATGTLNGLV